jgi:hypothetical protein
VGLVIIGTLLLFDDVERALVAFVLPDRGLGAAEAFTGSLVIEAPREALEDEEPLFGDILS